MKSIKDFAADQEIHKDILKSNPDFEAAFFDATEYIMSGGCTITTAAKWLKNEVGVPLAIKTLQMKLSDAINS
jgi:hypothetical protein